MNGRRRRTPATKFLLIAILIGFAIEVLTGAWLDGRALARLGAISPYYVIGQGQYWRLLTAMFLHGDGTVGGDVLHLVMNVVALFQLGTLYELMFGTKRFTIIYFVTGIVASITSLLMPPHGSSVGASGAIFGIMGAFVFSILRSPRFRHERAARGIVNQIVFWAIANIVIGMRIPQIDISAHIGGLVAGLLIGALWPHRVPPPPPTQVVVDVSPSDIGVRRP